MRNGRRPRLIFYANCLGRGGAHQSMLAWLDLLRASGEFELGIYCHSAGWFTEQLERRGMPYRLLPMPGALARIRHGQWRNRGRTALGVVSMLPRLLLAWGRAAILPADAVVLTGGRDFLVLLPLVLRRRRHAVAIPQTSDWAEIPACRTMCRMVGRVYAISDTIGRTITDMGVAAGKVTTEPLIYTADQTGRLPDKPALRRELGIPDSAPVLGMTGVIRPHKGQREAILVVEKVRAQIPGVRLLIAGTPPPDTPESAAYHRELLAMVEARGLAGTVSFLGWRDDVPRLMHAFDALLVPSHNTEGVPRVILEALEAGLPIFATEMPQFQEIAGRHGVAFLNPVDATEAWARDIVRTLARPGELAVLSRKARSVWEQNYSEESARAPVLAAFRALAPAR